MDKKTSQIKTKEIKTPGFAFSITVVMMVLATLIIGIPVMDGDYHTTVALALIIVCIAANRLGYTFADCVKSMIRTQSKAMGAMMIFMMVGAVVGSWMKAGSIPSLIYYGLNVLKPSIFLPAGFLLCCVGSMATGTSWGTAGTLGVVVMGVGVSLGIPAPIVAGAALSGALFGDKMSPVSDSTNLAPAAAGTDLYSHIKTMALTTTPMAAISLAAYTIIGIIYGSDSLNPEQIKEVQDVLTTHFNINVAALLPIVITLTLSFMKKPPLVAMAAGVVSAVIVGAIFQPWGVSDMLLATNYGNVTETEVEFVKGLLNRGGLQSMMWSYSLAFIIICTSGVLEGTGMMEVIVSRLIRIIKKPADMVVSAILTAIFLDATCSDSYPSVILTGQLYGKAFDKEGLDRSMLSRCCEEGGTLWISIIPWTSSAVFYYGALGVSCLEYFPWAFLCWGNALLSIILVKLGKTIVWKKQQATDETELAAQQEAEVPV